MSSVYVSEPPTKGKVIVHTSHGPLDIELWPKEAPKAVRNFVQLCLEGYYDNTIFHRIIKSFLVQGGDPTGTGTGGESIYGSVFADEFHSRLRFNHRGLVACANSGPPHSNGSQFFLSVDRCDWLDRKHTIFGKVTGDSMYNLLQLSEVETDGNDRPLDQPPIIISVEVLWNPFEDIVPRVAEIRSLKSEGSDSDKKHLQKAAKNLSLLSFGEEAEEDEKETATTKQKIKSSHDVLNDPRLLKDDTSSLVEKSQQLQLSVREALRLKKESPKRDSKSDLLDSDDNSDDEDECDFDSRMRQQILRKRKELGDLPPIPKQRMNDREACNAAEYEEPVNRSKWKNIVINDEPIKEKLSIKRRGIGSELKAVRESNADVDLQLLGEAERGWYLLKQKKRRLHGREDKVLEKLEKFKKDLSQKQITSSGGDGNEEDISNWGTVPLKFAPEHGKMSRKEDVDDYVVHDPLLEKGKEKFNRMQAREKRRGREWAGKSLT